MKYLFDLLLLQFVIARFDPIMYMSKSFRNLKRARKANFNLVPVLFKISKSNPIVRENT